MEHRSIDADTDLPAADPWGPLPARLIDPGVREAIRSARRRSGSVIAVLDDDPTGSQSVHGVQIITTPDAAEYRDALVAGGDTAFALTNTRSMDQQAAVELNETIARGLFDLAAERGLNLEIISRSDSTLRGHVLAEVDALNVVRRERLGSSYDGVLLAPAFFEAGRVTVGDVHWARVDGRFVPVAETEFARDATFGYVSSDLRGFLVERSQGAISHDRIHSIGIDDIRLGGASRVSDLLLEVVDAEYVVVNAVDYSDLETVVLGVQMAQAAGKSFLYRTGPSFVRALDGQDPRPPLAANEMAATTPTGAHGLVVVGSHVSQTSRQLDALRDRLHPAEIELDVNHLLALSGSSRDDYVAATAKALTALLESADAVFSTSRVLVAAGDRAANLRIAREISAAVSSVVFQALSGDVAWVVAKGGITSHDVAIHGLGIRRAEVVGQLFDGLVSMFRPLSADPRIVGRPYVVFAGNVGDDLALADVVDRLSMGTG